MTCTTWLPLLLALEALALQQPGYKETVDVSRLLVDVRVVDAGRAVLDLAARDFAVKIDGKQARVDSIQWVGGRHDQPRAESVPQLAVPGAAPRGRLIVFLVQRDLESSRITGLMRAMIETPGFLEAFSADDRLAVLSFDSRLRLWLDFTNDLEQVRSVLQRSVLVGGPAPMNQSGWPSLADRLPAARASKTYSIEDALTAVGEALAPLPGPKTVVLLGYGFGRLTGGRNLASSMVMMERGYEAARRSLQTARASVFCLDITNADYHSLEAGLQAVAEDTGGFFVRTHIFTKNAFDRLAAALAGHYVLFVEKPNLRRGTHRVDVKLVGREGSVLARSVYVD